MIVYSRGLPPRCLVYRTGVDATCQNYFVYHDEDGCREKIIGVVPIEDFTKRHMVGYMRMHEKQEHGYYPSLLVLFKRWYYLFTSEKRRQR